MIGKNLIKAAVATAVLLGAAGAAEASTIYSFNLSSVAEFGSGPYGTVTLTQSGTSVDVTVALRSDMNFVTTGGPHATFAFMLSDATTSDISNVLFNGASNVNYTVVAPGTGTPYGTNFTMMIDCTGAGCKNGAPGQISDPLTFTVANALESDFAFALSNGGAYFAADVICTQVSTLDGCNGKTGTIAVSSSSTSTSTSSSTSSTSSSGDVPEPGSLTLLGLGLLGFGAARRRRVK